MHVVLSVVRDLILGGRNRSWRFLPDWLRQPKLVSSYELLLCWLGVWVHCSTVNQAAFDVVLYIVAHIEELEIAVEDLWLRMIGDSALAASSHNGTAAVHISIVAAAGRPIVRASAILVSNLS